MLLILYKLLNRITIAQTLTWDTNIKSGGEVLHFVYFRLADPAVF